MGGKYSTRQTVDFLMAFFCMSFFSPLNQPLPLVAPPPGTSVSAIHHASTFCRTPLVRWAVVLPSASTPLLLQLCLVPRPLLLCSLARDSVWRCLQFTSVLHCAPLICLCVAYPSASASCVAPLLFGWLLHITVLQPLPLITHHHFCCRSEA